MILNKEYSFWGSLSPLGGLSGAALIVMATARFSWAIVIAGSLFWVYSLATLTYTFLSSVVSENFFPKNGRSLIFNLLSYFFGSSYLLLFWLLTPLAAFELFLLLLLVPLFYVCSGIFERINNPEIDVYFNTLDHVSDALSQAAILAFLIIGFSIIREPLAYSTLSLPGTYQGMLAIINFRTGEFFPIGIFAGSAGALLLLGYIVCLYQYCKNILSRGS